uniref:Uncharacterized protein LOC104211440 isoform X2 n=1 Tax=Nicotiana sylvestris TaxID=4096 RepID=A0A1U7V1E6_NICSY|nr:PREDICTED: uncharacterized protein LOC104211440 isoform X2 [Nicotiana sylvestris]XP_009758797.1 PREDICTED: uncharacterized protein LOC104211440 isoform X2 [Nicotiana sylvestris]
MALTLLLTDSAHAPKEDGQERNWRWTNIWDLEVDEQGKTCDFKFFFGLFFRSTTYIMLLLKRQLEVDEHMGFGGGRTYGICRWTNRGKLVISNSFLGNDSWRWTNIWDLEVDEQGKTCDFKFFFGLNLQLKLLLCNTCVYIFLSLSIDCRIHSRALLSLHFVSFAALLLAIAMGHLFQNSLGRVCLLCFCIFVFFIFELRATYFPLLVGIYAFVYLFVFFCFF